MKALLPFWLILTVVQGQEATVGCCEVSELLLTRSRSYANPFFDVTVAAGRGRRAHGFYDGGMTWRIFTAGGAGLAVGFQGTTLSIDEAENDYGKQQRLAPVRVVDSGHVSMTIADLAGLDGGDEKTWTGPRMQSGVLRLGGLRTAALLAAPGELVLHHAGAQLDFAPVPAVYEAAGRASGLEISASAWSIVSILQRIDPM